LFKVNVDSDRLYVVKRIILVEGKTKVTFVVHPRSLGVLLRLLRIVLPWTNLNFWVALHHICSRLKAFSLIVECFLDHSSIEMSQFLHFGLKRRLNSACILGVGTRASITIEVFFEF